MGTAPGCFDGVPISGLMPIDPRLALHRQSCGSRSAVGCYLGLDHRGVTKIFWKPCSGDRESLSVAGLLYHQTSRC